MSVLISAPIGMAIIQYSNLNHACDFVSCDYFVRCYFCYGSSKFLVNFLNMNIFTYIHVHWKKSAGSLSLFVSADFAVNVIDAANRRNPTNNQT